MATNCPECGSYFDGDQCLVCRGRTITRSQPTAVHQTPFMKYAAIGALAVGRAGVSTIRFLFALVVLVFVVFSIWGYGKAHTIEFQVRCAAYQARIVPMSFPDSLLCVTYGNMK